MALTLSEGFTKVLEADSSAYTVRVQSGLTVLNLLRWAEANGMATPIGAPTNYGELTIGGVISANGHGTGSNVTSSMVRLGKGVGGCWLLLQWLAWMRSLHHLLSPRMPAHCCHRCSQGDIALEFTWVDASGTVHTSSRQSAEGRGLAGGLGLIGIITEVKLQMTPPSSTKVASINALHDANIGTDVLQLVHVRCGARRGLLVFVLPP